MSFDFLGAKRIVDAIANVKVDNKADGKIYNINGQFVGTDPARLPKGLYIMNGKKVIL